MDISSIEFVTYEVASLLDAINEELPDEDKETLNDYETGLFYVFSHVWKALFQMQKASAILHEHNKKYREEK